MRTKRKTTTTISGLDNYGVKLADAAKIMGKKFACGASVCFYANELLYGTMLTDENENEFFVTSNFITSALALQLAYTCPRSYLLIRRRISGLYHNLYLQVIKTADQKEHIEVQGEFLQQAGDLILKTYGADKGVKQEHIFGLEGKKKKPLYGGGGGDDDSGSDDE